MIYKVLCFLFGHMWKESENGWYLTVHVCHRCRAVKGVVKT